MVANFHYAKVRLERGKWIIRDLRPHGGKSRDQSGFSGVRKPNQAYVGQQLQLEPERSLFARLPSSCSVGAWWVEVANRALPLPALPP